MQPDLYNDSKIIRAIEPQTVGTTGTGRTGKVIDRLGYLGVVFYLAYGTVTATNATFTVTLKEGDVTGTMTSVADADMLPNSGGEAAAAIGATATRVSGTSKNVAKKLGYIGAKRYVQVSVKSTVTAATPISVVARLGRPIHAPAA